MTNGFRERLLFNFQGSKLKKQHIVGVSNGEGPPVPIPNTEVKLTSVDNTLRATVREDRSTPTSSCSTRVEQITIDEKFCTYNRLGSCCSIFGDHSSKTQIGGVAQLGEHLPCKQGVMGSNPIISTKDDTNHVHREVITVCSSGG